MLKRELPFSFSMEYEENVSFLKKIIKRRKVRGKDISNE